MREALSRGRFLFVESLESRCLLASHNADMPYDVNGDGTLTAADHATVLSIVSDSRPRRAAKDAMRTAGPPYSDVNRDGRTTASDVLAVANALNAPAPEREPVLWSRADGGNGHHYSSVFQSPDAFDLHSAIQHAESLVYEGRRGHLLTITSEAEAAFVFNNVLRSDAVGLIGLTDNESYGGSESWDTQNRSVDGWRWITGEPVSYVGWAHANPNNGRDDYARRDADAVTIDPWAGEWRDNDTLQKSATYYVEFAGSYAVDRPGTFVAEPVLGPNPPPRGEPIFWSKEQGGNDHWYQQINHIDDPRTWTEAKAEAAETEYLGMRGHLVTMTNSEEAAFVMETVRSLVFLVNKTTGVASAAYGYNWIGAELLDGKWQWVTGEDFAFAGWREGFPIPGGGDYSMIGAYGWYSTRGEPLNARSGYIVEFE